MGRKSRSFFSRLSSESASGKASSSSSSAAAACFCNSYVIRFTFVFLSEKERKKLFPSLTIATQCVMSSSVERAPDSISSRQISNTRGSDQVPPYGSTITYLDLQFSWGNGFRKAETIREHLSGKLLKERGWAKEKNFLPTCPLMNGGGGHTFFAGGGKVGARVEGTLFIVTMVLGMSVGEEEELSREQGVQFADTL